MVGHLKLYATRYLVIGLLLSSVVLYFESDVIHALMLTSVAGLLIILDLVDSIDIDKLIDKYTN